jgi:hypothetical protein
MFILHKINMGSISGKQVGDFQANVGKAGATMNLVASIFFAVLLTIFGVILTIMGFIPLKPSNCPFVQDVAQQKVNTMCIGPDTKEDETCNDAKNNLEQQKQHCATKKPNRWFLLGILLIPLAILIVFASYWWQKEVHRNRTAAQIGGVLTEASIVQDIFGHNQ